MDPWPTEPWMTLGDDGDGALDSDWPLNCVQTNHSSVSSST